MQGLKRAYCRIKFECFVIYLFICSDIIDCLFVGTSFGIACYFIANDELSKSFVIQDFAIILSKCLVFVTLYLLPFSISNQLPENMILEDKINKPYRPLPRGSVTVSQAKSRLYIYGMLYILISFYYDCLLSCIAWITFFYLHNLENWSRFWFFKNLVMAIGLISLLYGQWSVISFETNLKSKIPSTKLNKLHFDIIRWIVIESFCIGVGVSMQDIRDIKGDKMIGRMTLPIVLNEKIGILYTRIAFCVINVVILPWVVFSCLYNFKNWQQISCAVYLQLHQFYIGFRLFQSLKCVRNKSDDTIKIHDKNELLAKQDDITYQLWAIWFIILHLTSYFVINV